jgi:hypothetical protein
MLKQKTDGLGAKPTHALTRTLLLLGLIWTAPAEAAVRSWDDAGGSADKNWSNFGNWSPDGAIAFNDDIFIGNLAAAANDTTIYDITTQILTLTLTNGTGVDTNGNELIVNGLTTISDAGTTIFVNGNSTDSLDTDNLTINSGATLNLNSTTANGEAVVEVDGGTGTGLLDLNAGGTITGQGRIDFEATAAGITSVFVLDGTLTANRTPFFFGQAPVADTLRLNDGGNANRRFDWDGSGLTAVININGNQTLDVDISTGTDAWSATMNLATGSTLDMRDTWSMDSGTINANTPAFGLIIIGQDPNPGPAARIAGANWTMTGGTINVDDTWDSLQLDSQLVASGGAIENEGTMIFNGGATIQAGVDFNMTGAGASLVVNSAVNIDTPDFNLDGNEAATNVTTINAGGNLDLDLGVGADTSFGHTINMNGGELDVTSTAVTAWQLNSIGTINAAGGATSTINSSGETFQVSGDINVTANSTLNINSVTEYFSTANVVVAAGSILNHGTTTYSGGSFTGAGIFRPGSSTIAASTTWSVDTTDFDDGPTTINDGATLTVNADAIDDAADGIDGTTTVQNDGQLQINLTGGADVVFDGILTYNGDATLNTFLLASTTGSAVRFQGASSVLNVNGEGASTARIELGAGSTLNINTGGEAFRFEGGTLAAGNTNTIEGGTINGPGELQAGSGHALRGNGTINAAIDFDGSADLIAENGLLDVNGAILDVGTLGTSGGTAVLDVQSAWNTNITQDVRLAGGRIQGANITNDGVAGINGNGTVTAAINNNSRIDAESGGTLIIDNTSNNWDGTANTGSLNALTGNLELRDNAAFIFLGTVQANSGRQVFANGFELEFDPGSSLILNGGTYRSTNATDIGGTVTAGAGPNSTLQVAGTTVFESTSSTTLNGNLVLDNPTTRVQSGATFSGGSSLINANGRTLNLLDGADVDVLVENRGTLVLGASAGQTSGLDFQQTAAGTWDVELGGTGLNDFDRMTLSGLASLDGTLDISLFGGFTPSLGDNFTILIAGSVIGTFDAVLGTPGAGLMYDVIYNANNVTLSVVTSTLIGDLDGDGFVGITDLNLVLSNWNQTVPPANPLADPSGDNFVGIADLNTVLGNWNAGTPPQSDNLAIPEPTALLIWLAAGGAMMRRRA